MAKPIQFTVGGAGTYDPVAGASVWNNPTLAGVDGYIDKGGVWPYSNYTVLSTGGIQLLGGLTFQNGDIFSFIPSAVSYQSNATTYTNGFNLGKVLNALMGRLGWRQPTDPALQILDTANQTSKSGRYFNGFHALMTIPNLKALVENADISDADFNAWLQNMQQDNIMRGLNAVFSEPDYLDHPKLLFARWGRNDYPITNAGLFCGYEFDIAMDNDSTTQVDSAALYFDSNVTFNLYLFRDGKKTPIAVKSVTAVAWEQTTVDLEDWYLQYIGKDVDNTKNAKGAKFYIGYFQDDLGNAKAIQEQVMGWSNTFCFKAIPIASKKVTGQYDFDRTARYINRLPYGLNLQVSSFKDHTDNIIRKAAMFDNLQGEQMTYSCLELILYAVRSNGTEMVLKDQMLQYGVMHELKGAVPLTGTAKIEGIRERIEKEVCRLNETFFYKPQSHTIKTECW